MELIRDNVKVEWVQLGEGIFGEYEEENPEDEELLRFDVSIRVEEDWEPVDDASYCTNFPVTASEEQKRKGLEYLMDEYHTVLYHDANAPVKKIGEKLSWISPEWVEK